jgi:RNA polymerase sigma factor (TIGR02999 family)
MQTIYPILRALAQEQLRGNGNITLQATELANEAFIKLRSGGAHHVESKQHFMGFMAHTLRSVIVDHIRGRGRLKRGGEVRLMRFEDVAIEGENAEVDWIALDSALSALELQEPSYARLVELRYFLGYDIAQSADQLGVSIATANRMWRFSRAFLSERMRS